MKTERRNLLVRLWGTEHLETNYDYHDVSGRFRHRLSKKGVKFFVEGFFAVFDHGISLGHHRVTAYHIYQHEERIYYPPDYPSPKGINWSLSGDYYLRRFLKEKDVNNYFVNILEERVMDFAKKIGQTPLFIFVTWLKEPWTMKKEGLLGWMEIDNYVIRFPQEKVVDNTRYCLLIKEWGGEDKDSNKLLLSEVIESFEKDSCYNQPTASEHESDKYPGLICYR